MVIPTSGHEAINRAELQVGDWRVDAARNELSRGAEVVRLEPKAIEVLVFLARRAGQVVSRDEVLTAIWPGVVVGDDALTQAVIKLRKALGDNARSPTYIETISKRGYRLVAPVSPAAAPAGAHAAAPPWRNATRAMAAIVGVALVVVIGVFLAWPELARRTESSRPVIAVLPFANQSGDAKRDYFSDGVTEDIIDGLGRFSGLIVISRNSVHAYKERPIARQAISEELGARYIVAGSVREADGRLRVAVELSDAEKGTLLWSERYDGEGTEVFDIQDRIVKNIVGVLAVKLTRLEQARVFTKPTENLEAYDLVLRARALLSRGERKANLEARALLAQAQKLSPGYAESYAAMAEAELQRAAFGWMEAAEEGLRRAEEFARRALTLDDSNAHARAHAILGYLHTVRGAFDHALTEVDLAIKLNPSDSVAYAQRGGALLWLGRIDESIASYETARRFDPRIGPGQGFNLSIAYYMAQRYQEALAVSDALLARHPDMSFLHAARAAALSQLGNMQEAQRAAAQVRALNPFFQVEQFGTRFVSPAHTAKLQEGLRKAGL
ncbi:MAG TPA: winged helix-turn-helix domain-containing protein [Burkholderiaceae bacterium]|nr:winged helix-turn-helix domain-containing protein [Burkholderiaceae bacterium]